MAITLLSDLWGSSQRSLIAVANSLAIGECSPKPDAQNLLTAIMDNACVQNIMVSAFHLIFIALLLVLTLGHRSRTNSARYRNSPPSPGSVLEWISFLSTSGLSLFTVGLASWLLASAWVNERPTPVLQCIFFLVQAVAWCCLAFTVKIYQISEYAKLVRVWWIASFLLGTYAAIAATLNIIDSHKVTVTMVLSLASWPVYSLLLCNSWKGQSKIPRSDASEPLLARNQSVNGHAGVIEEKVTPFATAGILSCVSFWWLNTLLATGYRSPLEQGDIPRLGKEDAAEENLEKFSQALKDQESKQQPFSVFWALAACYWKPMAFNGIFALGKSITVSLGPIVLKTFIDYTGGKRLFKYEGYVLVVALFLAKALESISQRQWYFGSRRVGLHVRSALMAFMYRKDLRLANAGRQRHAAGEVVNYMSVDAYRIGEFLYWLHFTWTTALQICIALVILAYAVGWATLAGLAVILISMAVNMPLARSQNKYQTELMTSRDASIRATTEALRNMKILKLQAWEDRFKEQILKLREVEMKWLSKVLFRRAYNTVVFWLSPVLVSTVTFTACLFLGIPLTASSVFTALATLRIIQEPIRLIPDMVATTIQVQISLARVSKFLQEDELQSDAVVRNDFFKTSNNAVEFKDATLSWVSDSELPTLRNLSVKIKRGQRMAVCGAVGCGKSSFIQAILGEMPKLSGSISVNGTVAYVAQSAWIRSGTFRENILFGKPMNTERYWKTVRACALDKDMESFPHGDLTEIGERGMNMSGGQKQRMQLARAVYQDADVYLLDDPLSAVDAHTAASLFNGCIMEALEGKTVILVTHQVEFLPAVDSILLLRNGEIWQAGPYNELRSTGTAFEELVTAHEEAMGGSNFELSSNAKNPNPEQLQRVPSRSRSRREEDAIHLARAQKSATQLTEQEQKETGNTGLKTYVDYLKQANGFTYLFLSFVTQLVFIVGQVGSNWWMASEVGNPAISTSKLIFIYSVIALTMGSFVFFRSSFLAVLGVAASRSFFAGMVDSLFRAPMAFFDSTPTGRILSRISSDFSILDMDVAFAFGFAAAATMNALTNFAVNASITWQILFIVFPFTYAARKLQLYYLASARQLMRINGTTKAPIVNHFAEAIAGGSTIRAFNKEADFAVENLCLIDANASPFFHSFAAIEWLILRLEFLSATVLMASALFIVLLPEGHIDPGFAGLALSYGLSLNISVVFSVQNQCNLSNTIISVERIKQYMHLESEAPTVINDKRPSAHWPTVGKVELENLQVRYRPNLPLVLRGITCTFEGGQRVGVVGRTGSGKTTLISSLFRLIEPAGGRITIDGIDIATIGLHDLRSRLGIIPQEPTLFKGTVRFNLDPIDEHSDVEVWEALDKCQLGDIIREKPERLDAPVSDDGENWSVGQRQLFCLGRALLKRSRVLVLDEATASIDNNTDAILQRILRREFSDCTVVTVAHRIPTVIDSDMVLALHDGKMAEFDQPKKLLEDNSSLFARLVAEYWANAQH